MPPTPGAQERAEGNAAYWYGVAVKRAELLRAEERRHGETIDKMNREKAAAVAQAVQAERGKKCDCGQHSCAYE